MKKSTLLSYLTAATVITTTAGTFAVWDSLSAKTSGEITFKNPITLTANSTTYTLTEQEGRILGTAPVAEGTVQFNISESHEKLEGAKIEIIPVIKADETPLDSTKITFDIKDSSGSLQKDPSEFKFTDSSLETTEYTVTIQPKEEYKNEVIGKKITVELQGTLNGKLKATE